jgi:hypothetical protein
VRTGGAAREVPPICGWSLPTLLAGIEGVVHAVCVVSGEHDEHVAVVDGKPVPFDETTGVRP